MSPAEAASTSPTGATPPSSADVEVIVVGAGFAGIAMAIELRRAGITDFVVLEQAGEVGGTWRDNTYPGCDVMTPMYSFEPNRRRRLFARQPEILDYLRRTVEKYGITPHLRLNTEVVAFDFDDAADRWDVRTADGRRLRARIVVAATGSPHEPSIPEFPGRDRFTGTSFHSARWMHDFAIEGKRIAVVGTGASAVQFVPRIAEQAAQVTVFQRTPHRIAPDRTISALEHQAFRFLPGAQRLYRNAACSGYASAIPAFMHPMLMRRAGSVVQRENVELVTSPITELTEHGIATGDGVEREFDAIVYGTGFKVSDRFADQHIVGANGISIQRAWANGMEAFLGVAVHGFPNMFLMVGPNSVGGHRSIVFMIEAQARYIVKCLALMDDTGSSRIEVRASTQHEFNRRIQARSAGTVWNSGGRQCWCLDDNGVNRAAWPGSSGSYRRAVRTPKRGNYDLTVPADREAAEQYRGPALLDAPGSETTVQATLGGHRDPIDGRYHWYGRISSSDGAALPDPGRATVFLSLPDGAAVPARLEERDPWGNLRIAGVGAPPFPLEDVTVPGG